MKRIISTEPFAKATLDSWKNDFKNIFAIEVPSSDEDGAPVITGYFRKPTIDEIGLAANGNFDTPLKASMILYNTCLLGGHPDFENDEEVKRASLIQFKDVLKTRTASIKKL